MQPRNVSLGVAKQLGLDRPGEERQARAGAHSALACVMLRGTSSKRRCASARAGGLGKEKGGKNSKAGKTRRGRRGPLGALQSFPSCTPTLLRSILSLLADAIQPLVLKSTLENSARTTTKLVYARIEHQLITNQW